MTKYERDELIGEYNRLKAGREKNRRIAKGVVMAGILFGSMCFATGVYCWMRGRSWLAGVNIVLCAVDFWIAIGKVKWLRSEKKAWRDIEVLHEWMVSQDA